MQQNNITQNQLTAVTQGQSVVQNALVPGQTQGLVLQGQPMVIHNQNGQPTLAMAPSNLITQQTGSTIPQQLNIQPKPVTQSSMATSQFEKPALPTGSNASNIIASMTQVLYKIYKRNLLF